MIYFPIIGALALAGGTIMSKIVLKKRKIDIKIFNTAAFLATVIAMLPLMYFFWEISPVAFELKNILIFLLVIALSIFANLSLFYSMKKEKITNIEPAIILEPLFVILLAILFSFFTTGLFERNYNVIIPSIIAGMALVFSHVKKHHLVLNKYFLFALTASLFFALELVTSRLILDYYSPITFYFLRCAALFIISLAIFRPKFQKLNTKTRWEIFAVGALWVIYRVIVYYGYLSYGVIFTTLMIMLGPLFVYFFAYKFLKEKIHLKNIISSIIVILCVLYAVLM